MADGHALLISADRRRRKKLNSIIIIKRIFNCWSYTSISYYCTIHICFVLFCFFIFPKIKTFLLLCNGIMEKNSRKINGLATIFAKIHPAVAIIFTLSPAETVLIYLSLSLFLSGNKYTFRSCFLRWHIGRTPNHRDITGP